MTDHQNRLLFGAISMGYLVIDSRQLDRWRLLLEQGLGLHVDRLEHDELAFRIDDHARRIVIRRGYAEDVTAIGWLVREEAFDAVVARMRDRGMQVEAGSYDEARLRGVASFVRVLGPKGLPIELFSTPILSDEPLDMLTSGFVTGACGMGHVAMTTRKPDATRRFFQELFDGRISDRITQNLGGLTIDIEFLRFNPRHHTLAIAAPRGVRLDPIGTKIQHFNIECASIADLEAAHGRCKKLGFEMAHEIGQHPNDRELSFYVLSPSGFEIELGWNALQVDEATWQIGHHDRISSWGHRPENDSMVHTLAQNAGNLARGLRSLLRPEYSPFATEGRQ